MSEKETDGIGFFEKHLTIWVVICMVTGDSIKNNYILEFQAFMQKIKRGFLAR